MPAGLRPMKGSTAMPTRCTRRAIASWRMSHNRMETIGVHIGRRTLTGTDGSLLGIGDKLSVVEGLGRVSNETQRVFELWQQAGQEAGLPKLAAFPLATVADLEPS